MAHGRLFFWESLTSAETNLATPFLYLTLELINRLRKRSDIQEVAIIV